METKAPPSVAVKPILKAAEPQAPPRIKPQAPGLNVKLAENGHNVWFVLAPALHTLEDAMDVSYCWHAYERIKPGDLIRIAHQIHHFYVEQYVVDVDRDTQAILTHAVTVKDFSKEELRVADLGGAVIEEMGAAKFCIRQGKRILKTGFDTELEADAWLKKKKAGGGKRVAA